MNIGERQIIILEKSKEYLNRKINFSNISKSSVLLYLNSWDPKSLGNAYLKWKINFERSTLWFIYRSCKNFLSIRNYVSMTLHLNNANALGNESYDTLLLSWCKYSDFDENGLYHDRYFNSDAKNHENVLWLLLSIDNKIPSTFQSNVRIFCNKKGSFLAGLIFAAKVIFGKIAYVKFNISKLKDNLSAESIFSEKITEVVKNLNEKYFFKNILQPYEAQPFQHELNIELKKSPNDIKTIGYLHSVLMPLPTDLIWREGAPEIVYVHGQKQIVIMEEMLNWPSKSLKFTPSLRYKKNNSDPFFGWIFLPYDFYGIDIIINGLEIFLNTINNYGLPKMAVRCHPVKLNSKNHIRLMKELEKTLVKFQEKFDQNSTRKISIFIGATAAIIEALERDVEVVHITSDPIFESHQEEVWNNIEVTSINQNVYIYKLKEKGSYIHLGNEDDDISKMIA